jgi:hypothetical protein
VAADLPAALEHARAVLDFWPIAYYPHTYVYTNGWRKEAMQPDGVLHPAWRAICDLARQGNRPGELVVFPGFEWQGDGRHGDHNVFFLDDDPPLLRSPTLPDLYADIRRAGLRAIVIPHHTGYYPGVRSKDWSVHDAELSPFVEVFSAHGCSEMDEECLGLRRNWHMGPGVSGGMYADALDRGLKIGAVASTDEHAGNPGSWGQGLMGCHARSLTREALWEAFAARRVYGVTGDRIELDLDVEGAVMGEVIARRGKVRVRVGVRGSDAIDRVELLRNNRVIATHCHNGTWDPPGGDGRIRAKFRVEAGWGPAPSDIPDLPPRQWACAIEVHDGAVVSAEKCWRQRGQRLGTVGGRRREFGFITRQHPVVPSEANVFEIEARLRDTIRLDLDGRKVCLTLAEAMAGSRIVAFMDETAAEARRRGVDPDALHRPDLLYFWSYKVKLHRAIPEAGFTAELDHTDADPPAGANHYRARVTQRNGQAAWSSPVWVENP